MKKKSKKKHKGLTLGEKAEKALKEAVQKVVAENKQAGLPLVVWQDGKVVQIPPTKIRKTGTK